MGQQWLVAAGAVIGARGVERRKLVVSCRGRKDPIPVAQAAIRASQLPALWDGPPLFPSIGYDAGVRRGKERTDVYCDPWR